MRIYTRQGDKGLTRLADGTSLAKDDKSVETYGAIDELNSQIGADNNMRHVCDSYLTQPLRC